MLQTIRNTIQSFELNKSTEKDLWDSVQALQASPTQLVVGQEAIFNIQFEVDWKLIPMHK